MFYLYFLHDLVFYYLAKVIEMLLSCFQLFDVPFVSIKASLQYLKFVFAVILYIKIFLHYNTSLLKLVFIMAFILFYVYHFISRSLFWGKSYKNITIHNKEKHVEYGKKYNCILFYLLLFWHFIHSHLTAHKKELYDHILTYYFKGHASDRNKKKYNINLHS